MFWILRRTGAVNLFNSINNNYSSKSGGSNYTINSGKMAGSKNDPKNIASLIFHKRII